MACGQHRRALCRLHVPSSPDVDCRSCERGEQLWRIEQLTDGTFRIMPKSIPGKEGLNTRYCLYSAADSTPTLAEYDFQSDNSKWNFRNR